MIRQTGCCNTSAAFSPAPRFHSGSIAGASIATPTTLPGADQVRTYGLDGLGNWKTSNFTLVNPGEHHQHRGGAPAQLRQRDHQRHGHHRRHADHDRFCLRPWEQYGRHQGNGNLVNDGVRIYQYDAFNRLIQISDAATSAVLATYVYDALGRRIQKTINDLDGGYGGLTGDIPAATTSYYYDRQQIIEERDSGTPTPGNRFISGGSTSTSCCF